MEYIVTVTHDAGDSHSTGRIYATHTGALRAMARIVEMMTRSEYVFDTNEPDHVRLVRRGFEHDDAIEYRISQI